MATNSNSTESDPYLYVIEDLPTFNGRQAWTHTLSGTQENDSMQVGNSEVLYLLGTKDSGRISRRTSEMALIREVVQTGTAAVSGFQKAHLLKMQLAEEYTRLLPPDVPQHEMLDALRELDVSAENTQISNKIIRAAGYIAARKSLWVVTRRTTPEPAMRKIAVARLVGLARETEDEAPIHVRPVVKGKNDVPSVLKNIHRDKDRRIRPNVLDVIEGARRRS